MQARAGPPHLPCQGPQEGCRVSSTRGGEQLPESGVSGSVNPASDMPTATCFFQIVGSRLRIPQVTPADSGEYVCHVSNGAGSRETSLIVTIQGSSSSQGERARTGVWAGGCLVP